MNHPAQHSTDYSMGICPLCRDTGMISRGRFGVDACPACMRLAEVEWLLARERAACQTRQ